MKYLKPDIYGKACFSEEEEKYENIWEKCYAEYLKEHNKISHKLPKLFLKEYDKHAFHDNVISKFSIIKNQLKTKVSYDAEFYIEDYYDASIVHCLLFKDIHNFKTDLCLEDFAGSCDWIYSEMLPADKNRISIEVLLFSESFLYLDFSKLIYKKTKA